MQLSRSSRASIKEIQSLAKRAFRWATNSVTLASALLIVPPLSLAYYIASFSVNVIVYDEWAMVPLLQKSMNGTLSLSDLFAQHVGTEQRIFFHRIDMLVMERITRFNTVPESFLSWAFMCGTALLLLYNFKVQSQSRTKLIIFLPVSLLLFDFRQWESLLVGFYDHIYLMIFAMVVAFTLLESKKRKQPYLLLAALASLVASFSWFVGFLVWPIGLLQILLQEGKVRRRAIIWSAFWTLATGTYFYDWTRPTGPDFPSWNFIVTNPVASGQYSLTMLGTGITYNWYDAAAIGIVILLVGFVVLVDLHRTRTLRRYRVFFSIVMFTALYLLANTVGRAGLGVDLALQGHYTPVTLLGIACLYLLAISVSHHRPRRCNFGAHVLLALILTGTLVGYIGGWQAGQQWKEQKEIGAYILRTYKIQSDENIRTYLVRNASYVRAYAPFLEANHFNVFSEPTVNATNIKTSNTSALFSFVTINGIPTSDGSTSVVNSTAVHTITITGWALDTAADGPAIGVFLLVDGRVEIPTLYGLDRHDIVTTFNNTRLEFSGFMATFSTSIMNKGTHSISVVIISRGGFAIAKASEVIYIKII